MKLGSIGVAAVTALLMGCATLGSSLESRGEKRFDEGVEALARGDYRLAHERLSWVAQHYGHEVIGHQAILTLASLEIDPRNPNRRINVGADLAANYLRLPNNTPWMRPVAQTLYLLGLEMAAEDREAEKRDSTRASLPALPGPSVTARIRAAEQERDRLARRVETLEKQLSEKEQELERIRKTIRQ